MEEWRRQKTSGSFEEMIESFKYMVESAGEEVTQIHIMAFKAAFCDFVFNQFSKAQGEFNNEDKHVKEAIQRSLCSLAGNLKPKADQ